MILPATRTARRPGAALTPSRRYAKRAAGDPGAHRPDRPTAGRPGTDRTGPPPRSPPDATRRPLAPPRPPRRRSPTARPPSRWSLGRWSPRGRRHAAASATHRRPGHRRGSVQPPDVTLQGCTYEVDGKVPAGRAHGDPAPVPAVRPRPGGHRRARAASRTTAARAWSTGSPLPSGTELFAGPDSSSTPVGTVPEGRSCSSADPVLWTTSLGTAVAGHVHRLRWPEPVLDRHRPDRPRPTHGAGRRGLHGGRPSCWPARRSPGRAGRRRCPITDRRRTGAWRGWPTRCRSPSGRGQYLGLLIRRSTGCGRIRGCPRTCRRSSRNDHPNVARSLPNVHLGSVPWRRVHDVDAVRPSRRSARPTRRAPERAEEHRADGHRSRRPTRHPTSRRSEPPYRSPSPVTTRPPDRIFRRGRPGVRARGLPAAGRHRRPSSPGPGWPAFKVAGWGFFTHSGPVALGSHASFGVLASLTGTVEVAFVAMIVGAPVAICTALFLSEYAPLRSRRSLIAMIDLAAAIPSIIFGLWAFFELQPNVVGLSTWLLAAPRLHPVLPGHQPAAQRVDLHRRSGGRDHDRARSSPRSAARSSPSPRPVSARRHWRSGASRWQMIRTVVLPFGRGGMIGAVMLGLGRALEETIAVSIILGGSYKVTAQILQHGGSTISQLIAINFGIGRHARPPRPAAVRVRPLPADPGDQPGRLGHRQPVAQRRGGGPVTPDAATQTAPEGVLVHHHLGVDPVDRPRRSTRRRAAGRRGTTPPRRPPPAPPAPDADPAERLRCPGRRDPGRAPPCRRSAWSGSSSTS